MAVQIILKNSSVEDKRPTANQLTNGEVSLNYHEAGAFLCCRDTDGNIQQIGGIKISNDAPGTPVKGTLWLQPNTSTLFVHNGNSWLTIGGGGGGGGGGGAIDRIVAGDGIDVAPATGIGVVTVNADIDTERGLEFVAGEIAVKLGTGLSFNTTTGAIDSSSTALVYKGTIDLTTAGDVPATPDVGDTYANVGSGAFDSEWVTATGESAGTLADPGDLVVWNGTVWTFIPTGSPGGGGVTNLSYTPTTGGTLSQGGTVVSSTGTDADIPMAGHSDPAVLGGAAQAGLMSPDDKDKLDSIDDDRIDFTAGTALTWDDTTTPDTLNADIATEADLGVVRIGNGLDITAEGEVSVDATEITTGIDLGYTAAATSGTVTNTAGDNADIPFATSALAGLFIEGATPAAGEGTTRYVRQVTEAGVATWEEAPSGGGASVNVGDTAPADPDEGDLWYDTNCDVLKVFDDTDTWIESAVTMPTGGDTADDCREKVFYENEQQVDFDYTLNAGTNAMSAGPITIADGVSVGVPNGQTWTIVGGSDNSGGGGGDSGFWQRAGTTLSPVTAGDDVDLGTGDLTAAAGTFSDRVLGGTATARTNFFSAPSGGSPVIQADAGGTNDPTMVSVVSNSATPTLGSYLVLAKQKSGAVGGNTPVANGDHLGNISFQGSNGVNFVEAARINCAVDSTPAAGRVGAGITFSTSDGTTGPTANVEITGTGNLLVGGTLPATPNITLNANGAPNFLRQELSMVTAFNSSAFGIAENCYIHCKPSSNPGDSVPAVFGVGRANGKIYTKDPTVQPLISERRLKENIIPVDAAKAWDTIKSVPYYAYNFIDSDTSNVVYGPMADEVPAEMVIETDRSDGEGVIRTYDNGMLQARLYTALQTALTRIEALEAEVQSLKEAN